MGLFGEGLKLGKPLFKTALKEGEEAAPALANTFKSKISRAGKHASIGAGIGGLGGAIGDGIDILQGDHGFDWSDLGRDVASGAALGGLGGGLGGYFGGGKGILGSLLGGASTLAGHAYDGPKADAKPGQVGSPIGPSLSSGGNSLGSILSLYDDGVKDLGPAPSLPTMELADYMKNPRLNGIAQDMADSELIPLREQQRQMREDRTTDLSNNEELGRQIDTQMGAIGRSNADATLAIQDAHDKEAQRVSDEAHDEVVSAGANQSGNAYENATTASHNAELAQGLADRRMADSELLKRLGVSGGEVLAEMAAAEQMQTGQNATKIRTSYDDKISENAAAQNGVQAKKSGFLAQLAQGAFDDSIQKYQAGNQMYQTKLSAAMDRANAAQMDLQNQTAMTKAQGAGMMEPQQMYAGSGSTIMNPLSGHADEVPIFATWPREYALAMGIPADTYDTWQAQLAQAQAQG